MAFKIFLSYSVDPDEQAIVWRLQTLAAAHGMEIFVPARSGFVAPASRRSILLGEQTRKAIERSDCVLAIITTSTDLAVEKELTHAHALKKPIIPVVEASVRDVSSLARFKPIFRFSRLDPPGKIG